MDVPQTESTYNSTEEMYNPPYSSKTGVVYCTFTSHPSTQLWVLVCTPWNSFRWATDTGNGFPFCSATNFGAPFILVLCLESKICVELDVDASYSPTVAVSRKIALLAARPCKLPRLSTYSYIPPFIPSKPQRLSSHVLGLCDTYSVAKKCWPI